MDRVPLKSAPSVGDLDAHLTQGSLGPPTQVCPPSIGSVVFAQRSRDPTPRYTDHATCDTCRNGSHQRTECASVGDVVQKFRGPIHERSSDKLTTYLITVESAFSPNSHSPSPTTGSSPTGSIDSPLSSSHTPSLFHFRLKTFLFLFKTQD